MIDNTVVDKKRHNSITVAAIKDENFGCDKNDGGMCGNPNLTRLSLIAIYLMELP